MRKCNQKQCAFLRLGQGCRNCSDCGVASFIVSEDCIRCYECENVPNSCRWGDEDIQEDETNKEEEKDKKVIEVKAK